MKKKYKFTYKDGKEIEIRANKKFVKAHESGGCFTLSCKYCPLRGSTCPIGTPGILFKNTKLEEIKVIGKEKIEVAASEKRFQFCNCCNSKNVKSITITNIYGDSSITNLCEPCLAKLAIEIFKGYVR